MRPARDDQAHPATVGKAWLYLGLHLHDTGKPHEMRPGQMRPLQYRQELYLHSGKSGKSTSVARCFPVLRVDFTYRRQAGMTAVELAAAPAQGITPDPPPGAASLKLDNRLIHGQAIAGLGQHFRHHAIPVGVQYILHLHRFDDRQRFAGPDLLARFDRHLSQ